MNLLFHAQRHITLFIFTNITETEILYILFDILKKRSFNSLDKKEML